MEEEEEDEEEKEGAMEEEEEGDIDTDVEMMQSLLSDNDDEILRFNARVDKTIQALYVWRNRRRVRATIVAVEKQ